MQVIHINASTINSYPHLLPDLEAGATSSVDLTYSANWVSTTVKFEDRRKYYAQSTNPNLKAELEIHWLSIMNSFVLVILLTGFLAIIIMRVLRSDYARYAKTDEIEDGMVFFLKIYLFNIHFILFYL